MTERFTPERFDVSFSGNLAKVRWFVGDQKFGVLLSREDYESMAVAEGAVMPTANIIKETRN